MAYKVGNSQSQGSVDGYGAPQKCRRARVDPTTRPAGGPAGEARTCEGDQYRKDHRDDAPGGWLWQQQPPKLVSRSELGNRPVSQWSQVAVTSSFFYRAITGTQGSILRPPSHLPGPLNLRHRPHDCQSAAQYSDRPAALAQSGNRGPDRQPRPSPAVVAVNARQRGSLIMVCAWLPRTRSQPRRCP